MDQVPTSFISDLLRMGLPGVLIAIALVQSWVIRYLFNWGEEKSKQLLELSKVSQEDSRRAIALIAELTPVVRDQAKLGEKIEQVLNEVRDRSGRRR